MADEKIETKSLTWFIFSHFKDLVALVGCMIWLISAISDIRTRFIVMETQVKQDHVMLVTLLQEAGKSGWFTGKPIEPDKLKSVLGADGDVK